MKLKKVLAGALAVVMAAGTILVAPVGTKAANVDGSKVYDATEILISDTQKALVAGTTYNLSADILGLLVDGSESWNSAGGDQFLLKDDFDVTIRFYNDAFIRNSENWSNFVFEILGGADTKGVTFRADSFGWLFGDGTQEPTWTFDRSWGDDWDNWAKDSDEQFVDLNVKKADSNTVVVSAFFEKSEAVEKYTITYPSGVPSEMRIQVGADGGKIYLSKFVDNKSTGVQDNVITWTSSKESVATVDATGKVTAVAEGTATITATCGILKKTCEVSVSSSANLITGIEAAIGKTEIKVGETAQITVDVVLENPDKEATEDTTVTYTSSNDKVATVDKDGKVTAVAVGKATITAKVGEFTDTVEITVPEVKATALDVKVDNTTLNVGDSAQITATVTPADSTDAITYESSNGKVVTVEANGKVSAVGAGVATITVKAGELTKTIEFAVNETSKIEMDNLSIEGFWTVHTPGIEIQSGKTYTFTFDAKSKLSGENGQVYYCPVYVVYTNSEAKVNNDSADYKEYFVCRADNYGWTSAGNTFEGTQGAGYLFETNAVPEGDDWLAAYKATMAAGTKGTITAKLSGNNVIVVYDIAGVKTTSTIPVDTSKPVYLGLTGEQVDVTNIVAVSQTNNIANKGGAPVMPIALVVLGLGVVVIASKKKFAK